MKVMKNIPRLIMLAVLTLFKKPLSGEGAGL